MDEEQPESEEEPEGSVHEQEEEHASVLLGDAEEPQEETSNLKKSLKRVSFQIFATHAFSSVFVPEHFILAFLSFCILAKGNHQKVRRRKSSSKIMGNEWRGDSSVERRERTTRDSSTV